MNVCWKVIPGLGPATANDRAPKCVTVGLMTRSLQVADCSPCFQLMPLVNTENWKVSLKGLLSDCGSLIGDITGLTRPFVCLICLSILL